MADPTMPSAPELVNYIVSGSGYGLLVYFVNLLSRRKLAWWYQIEERDKLIEKAEKRADKAEEDCQKKEDQFNAWRDIAYKSLTAVESKVSK